MNAVIIIIRKEKDIQKINPLHNRVSTLQTDLLVTTITHTSEGQLLHHNYTICVAIANHYLHSSKPHFD